jgi:hypothetical protein
LGECVNRMSQSREFELHGGRRKNPPIFTIEVYASCGS